jgi:hypothetical protein
VVTGGPVGLLADQHGRRRGGLHQPVGDVDRAAHDRVIPALGRADQAGHHLAGVDPDPHREAAAVALARPDQPHVAQRQASPDRSLGVVLVGEGGAEDGQEDVAREVEDRPAEAAHLAG